MTLVYEEYGDENAPLLVFLHGGGVSSWMWDKQIDYFTHYHCVTIDLPEQGKNSHNGSFSIHKTAEQINELLEGIAKGKEIIIVGFSLGAQVIIQMLSLNSSLINKAIINSALVRPNVFMRKMIRPAVKLSFPLISNRYFAKLQSKTLYVNEAYFETYYKESSQMKADTLIRILEENMSFKIPNDFTEAKATILVTVGGKEKSLMKKSAANIVEANPNCIGIIIPNVGHGISLLKPTYFNELVEKWLLESGLPEDVLVIK